MQEGGAVAMTRCSITSSMNSKLSMGFNKFRINAKLRKNSSHPLIIWPALESLHISDGLFHRTGSPEITSRHSRIAGQLRFWPTQESRLSKNHRTVEERKSWSCINRCTIQKTYEQCTTQEKTHKAYEQCSAQAKTPRKEVENTQKGTLKLEGWIPIVLQNAQSLLRNGRTEQGTNRKT